MRVAFILFLASAVPCYADENAAGRSAICHRRDLFVTVRAGRALLGTDAPITSRAFRNQHSHALGKGLIRIVGSLAAGYFAASLFSDGFLELPPPPRTFSSLLGSRSRTNMSNSITRFFFGSSLGFVCSAIIAPPARAMMTTASWSVEQKPLLCGSMWRRSAGLVGSARRRSTAN